ncbi:MAG: glycosyltransferase [Bacteroidia bacterium]
MPKVLSIAICTYNRPELLQHCLDAIYPQLTDEVELIVVDNGTTKVEELCNAFENLTYVTEDHTGLSFARNTAIRQSSGQYLLYLDDDAKADSNFVQIALDSCKTGYKVFGGVYLPWYHYGQPKWFKDEYASNRMKYTSTTALSKGEYLSGGVMCIKKEIFKQIGEFKTDIGMRGSIVGYGEESELQDRMRAQNIKLIYEPTLLISHVVAPYKLEVKWFLDSAFNRGIDMAKYRKGDPTWAIIRESMIAFTLLCKDALVNGIKYLLNKSYYKENWHIDTYRKFYKRKGYIYQIINDQ